MRLLFEQKLKSQNSWHGGRLWPGHKPAPGPRELVTELQLASKTASASCWHWAPRDWQAAAAAGRWIPAHQQQTPHRVTGAQTRPRLCVVLHKHTHAARACLTKEGRVGSIKITDCGPVRLVGHKDNWVNLDLGCGLAACLRCYHSPRRHRHHG
jgi:hypothetical protein